MAWFSPLRRITAPRLRPGAHFSDGPRRQGNGRRHPLTVERLEDRVLLDSAGIVWDRASNLTLSFVPDGTQLDQHASSLATTFSQIGESDIWKSTILEAFQTWAIHANINIGVVEDRGLPFGTSGPIQQDPRFGDIRVGAIPLSEEVLAFSVPYDRVISGTWVGDVVFNSQGSFQTVDDIFSVALHEAGHVLGLGHSDDPNSPMHVHGISEATTPTAADIAQLQLLHGTRDLDPNEAPLDPLDEPSPPDDGQGETPGQGQPHLDPKTNADQDGNDPEVGDHGPGPQGSGQAGEGVAGADNEGSGNDGGISDSSGQDPHDGTSPADGGEDSGTQAGENGSDGNDNPDQPRQQRQGVRNDSSPQATRLEILDRVEGEEFGPRAVVYGDIAGPDDVDFYCLPISAGDAGPLTLELTSSGISLLQPHLVVLDESGNVLAQGQSNNPFGDVVSLPLGPVAQDATYFLRVSGAGPGAFGSYLLTAAVNGRDVLQQVPVDGLACRGRFGCLSNDELQGYFQGAEKPSLNDDHHQDDDLDASQELETTPGFEPHTRFHVIGSISDASDVDHYHFTTPDLAHDQPTVMTVTVASLDEGQLIPMVTVFERGKTPLDGQLLANGHGNYTIQVSNVDPDSKHFLRVKSAEHDSPFDTGNYRITVMFGHQSMELETFVSGTLQTGQEQQVYSLHVAQPQLFHLAIVTDANPTLEETVAVMTVTNFDHQEVYRVAAQPGQTRTSSSVLLAPGTHTVNVFAATRLGGTPGHVSYSIRGLSISEPIAVVPTDPTEDPLFVCPGVDDIYCYPNSTTASTSFLWPDSVVSVDPPPDSEMTEWIDLAPADWWSWYWDAATENSPPRCQDDAYETWQGQSLQVAAAVGLLANDSDPEAGPLNVAVVENASHGTVTLRPDGAFTYVPDEHFVGVDRFTYRAFDASRLSDLAGVEIDIQPTPPAASIQSVSPDPRQQPVDELTIRLTQEVIGLGLEDLTLTRDDGNNLLDRVVVRLSQTDATTWTLSGLTTLTDRPGTYQLTLSSLGSDIQSVAGVPLAASQTRTWENVVRPGDANADGRFDQFDIIAVMQCAKYATGEMATWAQGDWTGDGLFDQLDVVAALQTGDYLRVQHLTDTSIPDGLA